ncbi:uncharacterized protein LOC130810532 [Amaranthus tricolor]|uniref:uncharacterized protein LOC130810532 n=1 Tax=Amaranthus tricolor TaxID=29722 RepID=UPI0025869225|nr:uncharacterized protein LOC130810532 [Amaranthus tricolor]
MMNLVAISLIATSLVVSGLFSPNPQNNGGKEDQVIVKEGHRAVVVEYGDDVNDGKTKVSISSPHRVKDLNGVPVDEQISRAAASIAGVSQDVIAERNGVHGARPRELICDAYGRCKHKITGLLRKAKEKAEEAEEVVEEAVDKAKDLGLRTGRKIEESTEGVLGNAKEKVKEKGEKVKEKTGEMVEETGEKIKEMGSKGKKEISDIARRGKEVIMDVIWYVFSNGYVVLKETLGSMLSVTQLLGFASAYGMSIWVTFVMSHVLARVLPRQQFGMVQSKIYPVYFKAMVGSIGLALIGHLLGQRGKVLKNKAYMLQSYNLLSSLLFVLGNLLFLEPRATKVMFNRLKLEKEEGRGRDRSNAPTRVMDTVVSDSTGAFPTTTTTTGTTGTVTTAATTTTTSAGRVEEDVVKTKLDGLDKRLKKLNSYSSLLNIMSLMGLTWHLVYLSQCLRANC